MASTSLLHKLHALGPAVDWTSVQTAHPDAVAFFSTSGEAVIAEIKSSMLLRAEALGSGTHHTEIEARQMLDYREVQQTVASPEMETWRALLTARNIATAKACRGSDAIARVRFEKRHFCHFIGRFCDPRSRKP